MIPTSRALAIAAAAIPVAAISPGIMLVIWFVLGVLVVVDGRRVAEAGVVRTLPGTLPLGGQIEVTLKVSAPEGTVLRITDDTDVSVRRLAPTADVPDASGVEGARLRVEAGEASAGYRAEMRERGDRVFGDIHLRVRGPLGLALRARRVKAHQTVRVLPGIGRVVGRGSGILRRSRAAGRRSMRRLGAGTEFESLREYVPGDDPRSIDWKATARRDIPIVRRHQVERSQNLVLAIDCGRLMRERVGDRERLDFALAASMLLAQQAQDYGDRVGVLAFDREVRLVLPAAPVRIGTLAESLAGLRATSVEPNYPLAFAQLGRTFRRRSLVILFSDVVDGEASRPLASGMLGIRRQHLPLMVALRNPAIERAAEQGIPEERIRGRAAAVDLLEARSRVLERMGRSGVQVVDALPGPGVEATLRRYADIKARALL